MSIMTSEQLIKAVPMGCSVNTTAYTARYNKGLSIGDAYIKGDRKAVYDGQSIISYVNGKQDKVTPATPEMIDRLLNMIAVAEATSGTSMGM